MKEEALEKAYAYIDEHREKRDVLNEVYRFVGLLFKLVYFGSPEFSSKISEELEGKEEDSLFRVLHTWVMQPRDGQGRKEVVKSIRDLDEYIYNILFSDDTASNFLKLKGRKLPTEK